MRFLRRYQYLLCFMGLVVLASVMVINQFMANASAHIKMREDFILLHDAFTRANLGCIFAACSIREKRAISANSFPEFTAYVCASRAFYRFRDQLRTRAQHYERLYGFVPEFKAGGNIGEVTGVEVGEIKREIAFHGDVLNTAARIQALCNEYGEGLPISEYLHKALPSSSDFTFNHMGTMQLRGRQLPIEVYAVRRSSQEIPEQSRQVERE